MEIIDVMPVAKKMTCFLMKTATKLLLVLRQTREIGCCIVLYMNYPVHPIKDCCDRVIVCYHHLSNYEHQR